MIIVFYSVVWRIVESVNEQLILLYGNLSCMVIPVSFQMLIFHCCLI